VPGLCRTSGRAADMWPSEEKQSTSWIKRVRYLGEQESKGWVRKRDQRERKEGRKLNIHQRKAGVWVGSDLSSQ
jgi:hypothetical protein